MRVLAIVLLLIVILCGLATLQSGSWLIVNHPEKADALVALGGMGNDVRYYHGLQLLRQGEGQYLIEDVAEGVFYGRDAKDLASEFVARTAGPNAPKVSVCPIYGDSTDQETQFVAGCLDRVLPNWHSAVLVTDDYHTRRALSIFRRRLPNQHWSAAATANPQLFGLPWWKNRTWAKTYLMECQKLLYWELWDRWRH